MIFMVIFAGLPAEKYDFQPTHAAPQRKTFPVL
jgi:hypothetical protein